MANRVNKQIEKINDDWECFRALHDLAMNLDISKEELALCLHTQGIFEFEDIKELLGIEEVEEE